jgi:FtsP/CotA-like multicopper oxidase with cupredoxin domain
MQRRKLICYTRLILSMALLLTWGMNQGWAQSGNSSKKLKYRSERPTTAERKAAAQRAKDLGLKPGVAVLGVSSDAAAQPLPGTEGPGGVPHYYGPYGNWAYSPLPAGALNAALTIDAGGTGYVVGDTATINDAYDGTLSDTAAVTAVDAVGAITAMALTSAGTGPYSAPIVTITSPGGGTGAAATATLNTATLAGGMLKFVDLLPGIPGVTTYNTIANGYNANGSNNLGQYIPAGVAGTFTAPNGQVADYYEIALVEYSERMHSSLGPTKLRGYVQIETPGSTTIPPGSKHILLPGVTFGGRQIYGFDTPHYLGPIIVAQGRVQGIPNTLPTDPGYPKPVRIKFYNLLPTGAGGDLFLPVDETVPGAGLGPTPPGAAGDKYTQNRATIHLHGNNTVWLSDGNTHQWITPANENTPYPAGVSARNVPDMTGCASDLNNPLLPGSSGCMNFYYTNAQSARLQFYHDHAMGITRINVIAGEAAGYVLTDAVEQDMMKGTNTTGVNPGLLKVLPDIGIPLVIQDKTWVDANTIFAQDPTWNWGTGPRNPSTGNITGAVTGDLWYPHVYMPAQNPWDLTGTNPFGRWMYGPWFNPPVPTCVNGAPVGCLETGPVANPYYDPINAPWEPPLMPGTPNPSIAGEGFLDTPVVNGTAYPVLKLEPKAYRFRILNAANDRFFNLQLYVAADKNTVTTPDGYVAGAPRTNVCTGAVPVANCTEVNMAPVYVAPANQFAVWPSGIPDPNFKGPSWIQIGTEGGFLPAPVVVPQQPIGWNFNPTVFNFGNVNQHSLLLGSAERADVVVDFSTFAGRTLILYNDAPAAFPAGVPTYDYFTGVANQMDVGGAPTTQPGYGPNTRTIMQIQVGTTVTTPTTDVTLANLRTVFAKTASKRGVFEVSQDPIIVPQVVYNSAYNTAFPNTVPDQYGQIADISKTFKPIDPATGVQIATTVTLPFEMKAMHDEMSGVYDTQFGRMSGMLGDSLPTSPIHVLIPYGYSSPPTDLVMGSEEGKPVAFLPDGTQIWRIFHNGVDTHTIHTHLFHAQILNRVSQDGLVMMPPDASELGFKDTFRINPLEIAYLAMRPTIPTASQLPFEPPDSVRLIDPTLPEGATLAAPAPAGWFDPAGNFITGIQNHYVNFGWEYVWHCHILAHEEMDMMHSLVFAVPPAKPTGLVAAVTGPPNNQQVQLTWTDNSGKEAQYTIQRATNSTFTTGVTNTTFISTAPTGTNVTYTDTNVPNNAAYWYRVFAIGNPVGDTQVYPAPSTGFPTMSANSVSDIVPVTFTFPSVTSISPASGARGTAVPVTITGTNLTGATAVNISGTGITVSGVNVNSATQITATFTIATTAALGARNVNVTTPGGTTNNVTFTVINPPVPTLTSISPTSGVRGTAVPVTLTGTNLTGATAVTVSGTGITVSGVTVNSATQITATLTISTTAALGARSVRVVTPGGTSNAATFTVVNAPAPTLASITPNSAVRGIAIPVTLTGTNLTGATAVTVGTPGGISVSGVTVNSATQITATFTIAANTTLGARSVRVVTPGGTSNAVTFTVVNPPAPTLASITPNSEVRGAVIPVTLTGTNLTGATAVTVGTPGGISVSGVTVNSATQITATFTIAANTTLGARSVRVVTPGGTSNAVTFTVVVRPVSFTSESGPATLISSGTILDFGNINSTTVTDTVTLTVGGTSSVTFGTATVADGAGPGTFSKAGPPPAANADTCSGATIAPGSTCTITVRLAMPGSGTTPSSGTLTVPYTGAPGNPVTLALTGN